MHFSDLLEAAVRSKDSCLMLGLDPNWEKIPDSLKKGATTTEEKAKVYHDFCENLMEATQDYICGVKIQMAYFEVFGSQGIKVVESIIASAKSRNLIVMIDAKRGDIGPTCEAYASAYLDPSSPLCGDCVTVNPFLGSDSIRPFLDRADHNGKGVFILVRTSNPSALQFQDRVSERIADKIDNWNQDRLGANNFSNIGAVVGATNTEDLAYFRDLMPQSWVLAPGVGAQGGSMEKVLELRNKGLGVIIPVARAVIYAGEDENFVEAARVAIKELWAIQKLN